MKLIVTIIALFAYPLLGLTQHANEFYNNGAIVHLQNGAEVYIRGDVHMVGGELSNYGFIETQGNSFSDNIFQQRGTGTYRIANPNVNIGERQFISGSYAVRGGQSSIGVDDGSFYNLELANDQGIVYLVGSGNIADVRNQVDFWQGSVQNRILTHDIGVNGAITYPLNGSLYTGVFGMMNPSPGIGSFSNNTVLINGNMSAVDAGYIQGNSRRAIDPAGGNYGFLVGLEPAGVTAQKGVQYVRVDFGANNYDVVNSYFETASTNAFPVQTECSGNTMDYFGGVDHGEWMFKDLTSAGSGSYTVNVWPQDDNYILADIWSISKDDGFQGTANECGPTTVGLSRSGFDGFLSTYSQFDVVAAVSPLPIELIDISAIGIEDYIEVKWNVASENNVSHYELERSEDGTDFIHITNLSASGTTNQLQTYLYKDYDVRYFQNFYYRVKSVDYDGFYEYTPIVVASLNKLIDGFGEDMFNLYPNPTIEDLVISMMANENMELSLNVYDMMGQLISSETLYLTAGNTVKKINSSDWAIGVYNIEIMDLKNEKKIIKRVVKQ